MDHQQQQQQAGKPAAPAPFLVKTYEMVDDPQTNYLVSWSDSGCSFVVWNPSEFSRELLPKYFKHNNFSSFVRQLNTYGFRKIDPEQWEFANEEFIRGERQLLINIYRRKPIHSHSTQGVLLGDAERQVYEEEIKRLHHERGLLQSELQRYQGDNQGVELQLHLLRKQLQGMEEKQMHLIANVSQMMQNPGFASALMQQPEFHNKKRRLQELGQHFEESAVETLVGMVPMLRTDAEKVQKLDSSLELWDRFVHVIQKTLGEEQANFAASTQQSPVFITGREDFSGDSDYQIDDFSLRSRSSSKDIKCSPELGGCGSEDHRVESPDTSSICLNVDISMKSTVIDVNAEPSSTTADVDYVKEEEVQEEDLEEPTAVNDLFWEQFLTEAPWGPSDSQEVQSERRDEDGFGRESSGKTDSEGKFWWHPHYVNDLRKLAGHLGSTERT
ncbi:hypothetical protein MLD38_003119 [Melastoma candidum]|uniref:Uncharacterized protein n=3 Tax=Melastoma candidum TaxID=119954 RepID=A0ACB9S129_9MYRT|nr:hypothetical protein MLD38_003119 [Melastoma candidum]